jgi:hypothetical protein
LSDGTIGKKTDSRHGTRHRAKNHEEVLLALVSGRSRHELYPLFSKPFHLGGNSFPDAEFGASNLGAPAT